MELILSKTDNRIFWLLKILLGLCLATPLFISSSLLFPYTAPKAFGFRILIEIAAVFYFYLALKYPGFRPKKTALILAVLAFLAIYLLSAIFGVDFYSSFWGDLERMLGFWGLLHFGLFFLMLVSVFKTQKEWLTLLKISVGVSSLVALLAVIQKFSGLGLLIPQADRVYGTLGNAAFLGTYLVFNIFLAAYLLILLIRSFSYNFPHLPLKLRGSEKGEVLKLKEGDRELLFNSTGGKANAKPKASVAIYSLAAIIQLAALIMTGTRGALLGLIVGVLFCCFIFGFSYPQINFRKYFLIALTLIVILTGLAFAFRDSLSVQKKYVLRRLTSISLQDVTVQNRLILWQSSWQAWNQKPIFGWGPENYQVAANLYFDPRLNPYEAWYDRAHNFIFDYGVATGWLGLLSYLALAGIAFRYLKKTVKQNFSFCAIFGSLIIAYLIQNFFVFDTFISFLMLFFTLAMIWGHYSLSDPALIPAMNAGIPVKKDQSPSLSSIGKTQANRWNKGWGAEGFKSVPLTFGKKILFAFFLIPVIFSIYSFNLKPIFASCLTNQILSLPSENSDQRELLFNRVLSLKTFALNELTYQIVLDYLDKIKGNPQLTQNEKFYNLSSGQLKANIKQFSYQSRNYIALAWLNLYFSGVQPSRIDEAISQAKKAKQLSPAKKDAYFILVAGYFLKGETQKAKEIISQAQAISPELGQEISQYWQNLNI